MSCGCAMTAPGGGAAAACVPMTAYIFVDKNTTVALADQNGSACAPFATMAQAVAVGNDPGLVGGWIAIVANGEDYSAETPLTLLGQREWDFYMNGGYLGEIIVNDSLSPGQKTYVSITLGLLTGDFTVDSADDSAIYLVDTSFDQPGLTLSSSGGRCDLWFAGTWSNPLRGFNSSDNWATLAIVDLTGDAILTNCDVRGNSITCRRLYCQHVAFQFGVTLTYNNDSTLLNTLFEDGVTFTNDLGLVTRDCTWSVEADMIASPWDTDGVSFNSFMTAGIGGEVVTSEVILRDAVHKQATHEGGETSTLDFEVLGIRTTMLATVTSLTNNGAIAIAYAEVLADDTVRVRYTASPAGAQTIAVSFSSPAQV